MEDTNKSHGYRADIDGIRALAVLAVIFYHAMPDLLPGGFVGVDVFFVISGYLITKIIYGEINASKFSFANFYLRRIRRIFPALVVALGLCLGYGWIVMLPFDYQQLGSHVAASAVCIQNFIFWKESGYFDSSANLKPLLHLWSLAVEEQFYILFPPLLLILSRTKRYIIGILFALMVVSFVTNIVMSYQNRASDFFITTYRAWELLAGCLLAVWHIQRGVKGIPKGHLLSFFGSFLIIFGFFAINKNDPFPGWRAMIPVLGTALLIHGRSGWINKTILSHPVAVWIGLISYPLYLFHWPIISFIHIINPDQSNGVQLFAGVAISFALAVVTYYCVEKKLRHNKASWVVPGLVCAVLILGVLGLSISLNLIKPVHNNFVMQQVSEAIKDNGIQNGFDVFPGTKYGKLKTMGGGGPQTVFLGDSHMQQYAPRIEFLLKDSSPDSRGAIFTAAPASLPVQGLITQGWNNGQDLMFSFWKTIEENPKVDRVVIAARWEGAFVHNTPAEFNGLKLSDPAALSIVMQEFKKTIQSLRDKDKQVYIVLDSPTGAELHPQNFFIRSFTSSMSSGVRRMKVSDFLKRDQAIRGELQAIAKETGASVIDPLPYLSQSGLVLSSNEDGPIRCDESHLRPEFVRKNVTYLDETVRD